MLGNINFCKNQCVHIESGVQSQDQFRRENCAAPNVSMIIKSKVNSKVSSLPDLHGVFHFRQSEKLLKEENKVFLKQLCGGRLKSVQKSGREHYLPFLGIKMMVLLMDHLYPRDGEWCSMSPK